MWEDLESAGVDEGSGRYMLAFAREGAEALEAACEESWGGVEERGWEGGRGGGQVGREV